MNPFDSQVKKAKREKLKMSIALMGASGAGKTLSGLFIAKGVIKAKYPDLDETSDEFWSKIGVIDAEHKRALLYANTTRANEYIGEFFHIDFEAPFSTERYEQAIDAMINAKVEIVVIDSLSHAWEGEGGILEVQQKLGGRYQDWNAVKPLVKAFYRTLTEKNIHVISTIRTKQEYATETTETGKMKVTKLGTKPVQKDDIEFEMQVSFMLDMQHTAQAVKDNSGMFDGVPSVLDTSVGELLYKWLEEGADLTAEREAEKQVLIEKYNKILAIENVVLNDLADKLIKGADAKFGYGTDINTYPMSMVRLIIDTLLTKANSSKVEVEV
jgi:hypothetical protein